MSQPVANGAAMVVATDIHVVLAPSPGGPIPIPLPHSFSGPLVAGLVPTVTVAGHPVAVVGSVAVNSPPHLPTPPGVAFQMSPANQGTVHVGSTSFLVGGQPVARHGDPARTCNDPSEAPVGQVVAPTPTVVAG